MKKIAVIGAGFSGISAATALAAAGFDVTIYEKNSSAGGRARKLEADGFVFDMGPSWYWMPDVFEKYFNRFGKNVSDYYQLKRLDPSYRVFFPDEVWDIPSNLADLYAFFEKVEKGSGEHLKKFLQEGAYKYKVGMQELVYKPGLSLLELVNTKLITGVFKLNVFNSIRTYIKKYFKSPRLIQLLEFPILFLGASPSKTPALYSLMNYADMVLGTWYPEGGMNKIVDGMVKLAAEKGVNFQYNSSVTALNLNSTKIKSLNVNGQELTYDFVVAAADYHHVEQHLLPAAFRRYREGYWESRSLAPSSLIYYVGVDKTLGNLRHHNLFFDQDFEKHTNEIYQNPAWPANPLFYVCCPSKSDHSVAPPDHENLFILIPVATGLNDNEKVREEYFEVVMDRMEKITHQSIRENIVYKKCYAHRDFIADYNSYKGNAYGLANTVRQTANLKPSMLNKKVTNLYYTGQLTVPGPGVPPAIISGQVAADLLIKNYKRKNQLNDLARK